MTFFAGSSVHLFFTESIFTKGKNPARSVHVLKVAREVVKWGNWVEVAEHSLQVYVICQSWQEKGCSSQAETWQGKNILMKDFD